MLFYRTEGTFGQDDFKCYAEYVHLLDIGSQAYTEYDLGSNVTSFMMKHPETMDMRMGHIHSHNSMGVFFSGTDTAEIKENSAAHEWYLSLIVNNKNEMTAKIAFRVEKEATSNATYRYVNGRAEIFTQRKEEVKEQIVMVYDCEITKPAAWEEFYERIEEVRRSKSTPTYNYTGPSTTERGSGYSKDYMNSNANIGWSRRSWGREEEKEDDEVLFTQGELFNEAEKTPLTKEKNGAPTRVSRIRENKKIIQFLGIVLSRDFKYQGKIEEIIRKILNEVNEDNTISLYTEWKGMERMIQFIPGAYRFVFEEDSAERNLDAVLEDCVYLLNNTEYSREMKFMAEAIADEIFEQISM